MVPLKESFKSAQSDPNHSNKNNFIQYTLLAVLFRFPFVPISNFAIVRLIVNVYLLFETFVIFRG